MVHLVSVHRSRWQETFGIKGPTDGTVRALYECNSPFPKLSAAPFDNCVDCWLVYVDRTQDQWNTIISSLAEHYCRKKFEMMDIHRPHVVVFCKEGYSVQLTMKTKSWVITASGILEEKEEAKSTRAEPITGIETSPESCPQFGEMEREAMWYGYYASMASGQPDKN